VGAFATSHGIVKAVHQILSPETWSYLLVGADNETSLLRNHHSLDRLAFKPAVLRGVRRVDPNSTVHGRKKRLPVFLAPMSFCDALDLGAYSSVSKQK